MPKIRDALEADLPRILSIFNEAVENTTALWSITPVTIENRRVWLKARQASGCPVLAIETDGQMVAFGSFAPFRPCEVNRHTVEHSIYVDPAARRRGLGALLLEALIERARARDVHVMVGGIDAGNEASLRMHRRAGFIETGRLPEVGLKFGRWLDLVFMQKILGRHPIL